MAASAEAANTAAPPEIEKEHGRGHIGLVVLGSIAGGLTLGLVLVLGVFFVGLSAVPASAATCSGEGDVTMTVDLAGGEAVTRASRMQGAPNPSS